jgi:hypothetical protein
MLSSLRRTLTLALFAHAACFEESSPVGTSPVDTTASGTSTSTGTSSASTQTSAATSSTTDADTTTAGSSSAESGTTTSTSSDTLVDESSTTSVAACGNDVLEDGEMCDGTDGCNGQCEFINYACNPLNNAGCDAPMRCGLVNVDDETFTCMEPGPGELGDECGASTANDGDCGTDLTCLFHGQTARCDVGACCVQYCDLTEGESPCDEFEVCEPFFPNTRLDGLGHLGFCGS